MAGVRVLSSLKLFVVTGAHSKNWGWNFPPRRREISVTSEGETR